MTDKAEEEKLVCPSCGKPLTEDVGGWHCECGFRAYRTMRGTEITPDELMKIFAGQGSELSFTSKAGHPYKQKLKLSDDKKKLLFDIHSEDTGLNCPKCGKPVLEYEKEFSCEDHDFRCWKNTRGHLITRDELAAILEGKCGELGFTSKAGKPYKGTLKLSADKTGLDFAFIDRKKDGDTK